MFIKKLYNDLDTLVDEAIEGNRLLCDSKDTLLLPDSRITVRKPAFRKPAGYVKLVGSGGSGHEGPPGIHCGLGSFDAFIAGDVFTAPSATQMFHGLEEVYDGGPAVMTIANHTGDVLNARLCKKLAEAQGMDAVHISVMYNDIASAPKGREKERRGLIGCYNCAGMMAEWGEPAEEILRVNEKVNQYTRSYGVGIRSAIHPVTGLPIMDMPEDEIELGIGVHGESSGQRMKLPRSKELAVIVCDILLEDLEVETGEDIALRLHGLGGMTWMELDILYKDIYHYLVETKGLHLYRPKAGNSGTQELGGFIMSIARLDDEVRKWIEIDLPQRCQL